MTLSPIRDAQVDDAVSRLTEATLSGVPCSPVRDLIAQDEEAAYAVQRAGIARRVGGGGRVVGRKIGLTSAAVQEQLGVDLPDFGVLLDEMAYDDRAAVPIGRFLQPRVEAEVAFVLEHDLTDGALDIDQVRTAVDYAGAGAYVLGTEHRSLEEVEPREVAMSMTVTSQEVSVGTGAACLGDPLLAVQWLARRARDLGEPLRSGQVVLSGALGPMRPVTPGAAVTAAITGLGTVSCTFTQEEA